jgi:glutamate dehydrogenase/leucine dehydrogenase
MLLHSGSEFVANKISSAWESREVGATLKECLANALNVYAQTIADEIGYDRSRKLQALEVEVRCRIRQKQEIESGQP